MDTDAVLVMNVKNGDKNALRELVEKHKKTAYRMALGLVGTAGALAVCFFLHSSLASVLALYVTSTLIGTVLVPLFWAIVGARFTVSQGRRLLGPIAAAGTIGGAIGIPLFLCYILSITLYCFKVNK